MTIVLMGLGGLAAAAGTRLAAVGLGAAAVTAVFDPPFGAPALGGEPLVAPLTWVAALAAGWMLLSPLPARRLALPVMGGIAALTVGAVPNAAAVLGLWLTASVAGVASALTTRGWSPSVRRWTLGLWVGDVLVGVAVLAAVLEGFEGWPSTLELGGSAALLAAIASRLFLAAGPEDGMSEAGLVPVRAQVVMAIAILGVGAPEEVLRVAVVVFSVGMAAGGYTRRRAQSDAVQELCIVGLCVVGASLGWAARGWIWGALAGGTLIHYLRLIAGRDFPGRMAAGVVYGGGLGLPLLPAMAALLEGLTRVREAYGVVVLLSLAVGLAARARRAGPLPRRTAKGAVALSRNAAVLAAAAAAGLWAAIMTIPRSVGADAIAWPPAWASAVLVGAGLLGTQLPKLVPSSTRSQPRPAIPEVEGALRLADRLAGKRFVLGGFVAVALAALALWVVGIARGFL